MLKELTERYPCLAQCSPEIAATAEAMCGCFSEGGKLLICGNGGSSADADHIVGELMKGFLRRRCLPCHVRNQLRQRCPDLTDAMLDKLQQGLPAISLTSFTALNSAFSNDADPSLLFAQGVLALGKPGDLLLCISTSGNAKNVCAAAKIARGLGIRVIGLTGKAGGKLLPLTDICIRVPQTETYKVQELHLPVYHTLCAMTENHFFPE